MKLSILMPVYNEINTIDPTIELVRNVLPGVEKELVIVDDGSQDGTRERLGQLFSPAPTEKSGKGSHVLRRGKNDDLACRLIYHEVNRGKGAAIRTALLVCSGDVIVIQDADLEYDPNDWATMYELIAQRRVADVVYGSRFYGKAHRSLNYHHYLANRLISTLFNLCFNQTLTDIEVCYKMFTREVRDTLALTCDDFGFEVQISAQIAMARRWRIYEIGIHYFGRTYREGKKINWKDGLKALWYVFWFRLRPGNAHLLRS